MCRMAHYAPPPSKMIRVKFRDIYYAKYYGGKGGMGEMASWRRKKIGVREKNEKGKEKRRRITLKKG